MSNGKDGVDSNYDEESSMWARASEGVNTEKGKGEGLYLKRVHLDTSGRREEEAVMTER